MNTSISIVQVNDTHAYIEPHKELFWKGNRAEYRDAGGYARIKTLINQIHTDSIGNSLVFDCGDTIHGTYPAVESKGEAMMPLLNEMGFNAMTAHWEFAYGPRQFMNITSQLNYPMLAINCYHDETDELVFEPYKIFDMRRLKVGVIGIAATIIDKTMPEHFSKGIYFTLGNKELPACISKLKNVEKVDLVVLISHLGFPQELKLAGETDGIDILLSAHTHNRVYEPAVINDTIIIQSGCHGSFIGRLDIEYDGSRIVDYKHELVTVEKNIEPDRKIAGIVHDILSPHRDDLAQTVGSTATNLNRNMVMESTMDNFLLQGIIDKTDAQLAFSNGWRYGAPVLKGDVTLNDLHNIIPVNPPVSMVDLSGDELWNMMEENLERTFSPDPYRQMGGYVKRCLGLNMYFKVENPEGNRIQEMFVNSERVKPDAIYKAAYVTSQGVPSKYGSNRFELNVKAIDALKTYLAENSPVECDLKGAICPI